MGADEAARVREWALLMLRLTVGSRCTVRCSLSCLSRRHHHTRNLQAGPGASTAPRRSHAVRCNEGGAMRWMAAHDSLPSALCDCRLQTIPTVPVPPSVIAAVGGQNQAAAAAAAPADAASKKQ